MIHVDIEKKLKTYEGQQILKIASQFNKGSITKIYGPSGTGKTTFLKIIAGFIRPEKGIIKVNGSTWMDSSSKAFLPPQKRMVGFVFQDYALFPNMSVLEHLEYATKDKEWIDRLLYFGRLDTLLKHKPEYLSGGQQQRLAILRALATKPSVLLMDEPFSALDQNMRSILITELKALLLELETTCLIVSHNPSEIESVADQELTIGLPL